jgi:hypothetical protein
MVRRRSISCRLWPLLGRELRFDHRAVRVGVAVQSDLAVDAMGPGAALLQCDICRAGTVLWARSPRTSFRTHLLKGKKQQLLDDR